MSLPLRLARTTFRDIPVLPYPHWRLQDGQDRLEGGPVFPADAPRWVHMPMQGGRVWIEGPPALPPGTALAPLPGRHVFVGPAVHHFGHMLGEFLHRLWVLGEDPKLVPLLVRAQKPPEVPRFVSEYLRLIGAAEPVLVSAPTMVEELVVGEPGRLLRTETTPEYGRLIGARLPPALLDPPGQAPRLAILRGHLQTGRCLGEAWMEQALAAQGYRVFRPEAHSLAEQIAAMTGAGHIVFSEGSALHVLDLLPPIRARVAVIGRRPGMRMVHHCITGKVAAPALYAPRFILGSLNPHNPTANALAFVDPLDALRFLATEGFISRPPEQGFLEMDEALLADLSAYAAHWERLVGREKAAQFIAAAFISCRAGRQDPVLSESFREAAGSGRRAN